MARRGEEIAIRFLAGACGCKGAREGSHVM